MPVARRSAPRRRVYRTRAKYDYQVTTRRYKRLLPIMWPELEWELTVLLALEEECSSILDGLGIPDEDQQYYVGYTKRLWEIAVDFTDQTYESEKTSLRNEYILRDWNPAVLDQLENTAKKYAQEKKGVVAKPAEWPGVTALGGNTMMGEWPGATVVASPINVYAQWIGINLLGGNRNMGEEWMRISLLGGNRYMGQWGAVTVARGTVL